MRRSTTVLGMLLLGSGLTMAIPLMAAPQVAVIEVKGLVFRA